MNIAQWIEKHAAFAPDRAAIRFANRSIAYRAFHDEIEQAAGRLVALGVRPGGVVAYLGQNSPELMALLFACARLGAMLVPLNWRLAVPEHLRVLEDCRPTAVLVEPEFHDHAAALANDFAATTWVALGKARTGWRAWDDVAPEPLPPIASEDDSALLLCYTSGSTGTPKGVVHTHSSLFWNAMNSTHMHDLTSADRILSTLPMFHVGGLNVLTTPAFHAGASVTLHARFDPGEAIEAIERERITLTVLVPAQLTAMMAHPRWNDADFSSLRVVTTGSTIVPAAFVRRVHDRGLRLIQVYGSTETCPLAAYQRLDAADRKVGSAGLPALHCDVRIVDPDGADCAGGEDGEILVRGPNVMRGYLNAPEATASAMQGGWYHTGDVGHFDDDGYLYVVSRKTDMIISGGENVYPSEIESILLESPDIADVSVVGRPDPRWGEAIVAVVVLAPGAKMAEADVLALLDGRVARYKRPRHIAFADALPRNALGKVMKDRIRADVSSPREPVLQGQAS
jgi:fatty-acyl-CoA synthase